MKYAGADWLKDATKYMRKGKKTAPLGRDLTPFECKVADILGGAYCGIYHIEEAVLAGDWEGEAVSIVLRSCDLATFDYDILTGLVVMCHDACVRMIVLPAGPGRLRLAFHQRSREGGMAQRHPTIDEAIVRTRTLRADLRLESEREWSAVIQ